jgi:hypothetical protein
MFDRSKLAAILEDEGLTKRSSTDPRGLKRLLASLNVKGREFKAVADALSMSYSDEGSPKDMKDQVEIHSGGLPTSTWGEFIDWPLSTYKKIWDLYEKARNSYRQERTPGLRHGQTADRVFLNILKKLSGGEKVFPDDVPTLEISWKSGGYATWSSQGMGWLPFNVTDKEVWQGSRKRVSAAELYAWIKAQGGKVTGTGPQRKPILTKWDTPTGYTWEGDQVYDPQGAKIGEVRRTDWGGFDIYLGKSRPKYVDSRFSRLPAARKIIRLHEGKPR